MLKVAGWYATEGSPVDCDLLPAELKVLFHVLEYLIRVTAQILRCWPAA